MNVLLITSTFPTVRDAWPGTYVLEYARSLALQHTVTVVYPQQLGARGVGDERFFCDDLLEPRIRLINYTYTHFPKSWLFSYVAAFRKVLKRIHTQTRFDIIFAHVVLPAGAAAAIWGRRLNIPVILTEHWGPPDDWLNNSNVPRPVMRALLRKTYRLADYLTAVSDSLADQLKDAFGAQVSGKFDQPIDCDLFHPDSNQPRDHWRRVVCVTRIGDERKGLSNLIAAWKLVSQRTSGSARLEIITPEIGDFAARIEAEGIADTCGLVGWISTSELAAIIRRSAVMVIPSRYETFGRSGAEALASGVPVVSTRCGGPAEYVAEGTGVMVPIDDPEALAGAILTAIERREGFLPPDQLARRIRERFSYEAVCERFTQIATGLTKSRAYK